MKSKLNRVELCLCFAFWTVSSVFTLYKLYESQTSILQNNDIVVNLTDLEPGWRYLNRLRDISDIEWTTWKFFMKTSWQYLVVQFFISEIIRRTKLCHLKYWYAVSSFIYVALHFGLQQLFVLILQPLLFSAIIFAGGKKISIWITSVSLLMSYNSVKYKSVFWYFMEREGLFDEEVYLLLFGIPWVELRCISYCLDYLDRQKEEPDSSKFECFVDMVSYCLYAPLLYTGPVILYEEFKKSYDAPNEKLWTRLNSFIWNMSLYIFYTFMLDLSLHYIYFYALQADMLAIKMLPTFALCGGGLWMGVHFQMKYVIAYGTTSAFAKLDNMETPPTPRCIARIHVYSQMWRYFDVGLYKFLVKYIYKPSMSIISTYSNLPETVTKMLASLVTFSFIFMWHGTMRRIFIWSVLNYIGISLEYFAKAVSETDYYKWFKNNILVTDAMETRFIGLLCVPLLTLSAVSNFYLFSNVAVGDLYFECFLHPSFMTMNSILVGLGLYCCCIVSMALEDVPSRTAVRKPIKILSQSMISYKNGSILTCMS